MKKVYCKIAGRNTSCTASLSPQESHGDIDPHHLGFLSASHDVLIMIGLVRKAFVRHRAIGMPQFTAVTCDKGHVTVSKETRKGFGQGLHCPALAPPRNYIGI